LPKFGGMPTIPLRNGALVTAEPFDPGVITTRVRAALDDAEAFVAQMPTTKMGLLVLQSGMVV
jgi:hypothetical protein